MDPDLVIPSDVIGDDVPSVVPRHCGECKICFHAGSKRTCMVSDHDVTKNWVEHTRPHWCLLPNGGLVIHK